MALPTTKTIASQPVTGKASLVLVVLDQADQLLELLEGEVGLELVVGEGAAGRGLSVVDVMASAVSQRSDSSVQQYVETLRQLDQRRRPSMDDLDARLIELFAAEPRVGVLEASRRLGVARGTVQARLDRLAATG